MLFCLPWRTFYSRAGPRPARAVAFGRVTRAPGSWPSAGERKAGTVSGTFGLGAVGSVEGRLERAFAVLATVLDLDFMAQTLAVARLPC